MRRSTLLVLLGTGAVALLVLLALPRLFGGRGAATDAARPATPARSGVSAQELAALRAALDAGASERAALRARVAELERRLAAGGLDGRSEAALGRLEEDAPVATGAAEAAADDGLAGLGAGEVERLRALALDEARPTRDRVLAAKALWDVDLAAGTSGARTPELVAGLLALLRSEPDPELRRLICFHVLDAAGPEHKGPLLTALEHDAAPEVRAQAADTLQALQAEPDVRAALEWSSRNDASEEVRATAAEMLSRYDPLAGG